MLTKKVDSIKLIKCKTYQESLQKGLTDLFLRNVILTNTFLSFGAFKWILINNKYI